MHYGNLNQKEIMASDQEIRSMCWYNQQCVDEVNRFVDMHVKDKPLADHFQGLQQLLSLVPKGSTLLDIGTGSAMVAEVCKDFKFFGCDLPHMIAGCAMRNQPNYFYRSCDVIEDNLAWINEFDIILLNAVIDVMYNGPGVLRRVLTHARRYVIIHRQEVTQLGTTRSVINGSYGGKTYHCIINYNDFTSLVDEMGFDIIGETNLTFGNWEGGGSSFLLLNRSFVDKKYTSLPLLQLKNRIHTLQGDLKVVLGAGDEIHDHKWVCTNYEELDVENSRDWEFLFGERKATNLLAEHVWEHLSNPDIANKNAFNHLCVGGRLRIAVPDGFHPDPNYIDHVRPGGSGAGADDHKHLWNYKTLSESLTRAGFTVMLLEYWDESGKFNDREVWLPKDGLIKRCRLFDERNKDGNPNYTSLIIDAFKL